MSGNLDLTGTGLADAVVQAATARGLSINQFAAPLSRTPARWLIQLRTATTPKPATVERVLALLAGRDVPPPPANSFQSGPRASTVIPRRMPDPIPPTAPVYRDPCFFCGVRADLGCDCGAPL